MKKNYLKIISVAILLLIVTIGCKKEDKNVTGVSLDKDNITLEIGETATLTATVYPEDAANKTVSWTSSNTAVATVINGTVTAKEVGETTITVITEEGKFTATCIVKVTPIEPEEEGVIIDGVRWSTRNVDLPGTFVASPEDAGMFYQWNRKTGWSSTDPLSNHEGGTEWDGSLPEGDNWEETSDPCPIGWRVPTHEERRKLADSGSFWGELNGVYGRFFGNGEQKVFFPAAGGRNREGSRFKVGTDGYYWSSMANDSERAYNMHFFDDEVHTGSSPRDYGTSVRCVAEYTSKNKL